MYSVKRIGLSTLGGEMMSGGRTASPSIANDQLVLGYDGATDRERCGRPIPRFTTACHSDALGCGES